MTTPEIFHPGDVKAMYFSIDEVVNGHSLRDAIDPEHRFHTGVFAYLGQGAGDLAATHNKLLTGHQRIQFEVVKSPTKDGSDLCYLCPIADHKPNFDDRLDISIRTANAYIATLKGSLFVPARSTENL
jgi:hypothetical protein